MRTNTQWAVLGGLRFVLAGIVFCTHLGGLYLLPHPLQAITQAGAFAAVLGFLVISGYSIGASLSRDADPFRFYDRRLIRVYPVYFAATLLACVPFALWGSVLPASGGGAAAPSSLWPLIGNFFLLGGIAVPTLPTDAVVWSLTIEAVYYLFAPLLVRQRSPVLGGLILVSAAAYWLHSSFGIIDFNEHLYGTYGALALLWAWLLGLLLQRHPGNIFLLAGGTFLGCCLLGRFDQFLGQFSAAVFVGSVAVVAVAKDLRLPPKLAGGLDYLGELSYPMYLVHAPSFVLVACAFPNASWLSGLCGALLLSLLLLHGIDLPYRAYARRTAAKRQSGQQFRLAVSAPHDTLKSVSTIAAPEPASLPE